MTFTTRHILFYLSVLCVALAIARRPILWLCGAYSADFWDGFAIPFYHLFWLAGCEGVLGDVLSPAEINPNSSNSLMLGAVSGTLLSFFTHCVAVLATMSFFAYFWNWCNEKTRDK